MDGQFEQAASAAPDGSGPLSEAERAVLEQTRSRDARRAPSRSRDEFARLALLPALVTQPGCSDEVTAEERAGVSEHGSRSLAEVLDRRRSVTTRLAPVSKSALVAVLARSYRVVEAGVDEQGRSWSRRPVPSGGATHPFDLLVTAADVRSLGAGHFVFGTSSIGLRRLDPGHFSYAHEIDAAVLTASRRSEPAPATVSLIASVERVAQHYTSLLAHLFRDAGVLLQTMHLVATDLGLHSSIIGSAGQQSLMPHPGGAAEGAAGGPTLVHCGALVLGAGANDTSDAEPGPAPGQDDTAPGLKRQSHNADPRGTHGAAAGMQFHER